MQELELICYNCEALCEILKERNKKILHAFKEEIDELPENFSFCIKCLSNKKVSLEQEIKHREKVQNEIDKDYKNFEQRQKKFEEQDESIEEEKEILQLENVKHELQSTLKIQENLQEEKKEVTKKIKEIIDSAQKFEEEHHQMLEKINKLEQEIYSTQQELKKLDNKKEYLDKRIDFLQKFYLLQQIFNFEILEDCSKLNGVNIGSSSGEIDWTETNTAFGSMILLLRYLLLKNKEINHENLEIVYQGSKSFFLNHSEFDESNKKLLFYGPISQSNLVIQKGQFQSCYKMFSNMYIIIKKLF